MTFSSVYSIRCKNNLSIIRELKIGVRMSKEVVWFINGVYSAFSFSGKRTRITRRARKSSYYTADISTNSETNLRRSIGKISKSIENVKSVDIVVH